MQAERAQRRAGVHPPQYCYGGRVPPAQRARPRERFRSVGVADVGRQDACPTLRFLESLLSFLHMNWDHEPTPNPSREGNGQDADRSLFPSWEGSGVGRFMETGDDGWTVTECRTSNTFLNIPALRNARPGPPPGASPWICSPSPGIPLRAPNRSPIRRRPGRRPCPAG